MHFPPGKPMLGQLVNSDYLLDFDIFHVSAVTELLHYVDGKYLGGDLVGAGAGHVDTWIQTQHHVDRFTLRWAAYEELGLKEEIFVLHYMQSIYLW